ncbi:hypothetical protein BDZ91DRAFT_692699 [Kalaharituber pfeilii]|nr:hypothetical protein BDZ91DRAFT_692699 [Kalaharituber pfeilii]
MDAKADIVQDIRTLGSFIIGSISRNRAERRNKLNIFFQLEAQALNPKFSEHPFLIFEGRTWTYRQAYETILKYGSWLKDRHHVARDEVVAMDFINKPAFIWLWLGLWSIGAKAAMVNYNLGGDALMHSIKTSSARLVIVDQEVAGKVLAGEEGNKTRERLVTEEVPQDAQFTEREVLIFDEGVERVVDTWTGRREPDALVGGRKIGDTGALVYTSGTTGLPKPANISFSKTHYASVFIKHFLRLRPADIFYTCMPLYHSSALLLGCAAVIQSAATLSLGRRFSNRTFWPEVKASKATIIQYVGETCRYLLAAPKPADPAEDHNHNVRIAFGNGLRPEIWDQFRERFNIPVIAEFYATTEGTTGVWNYNTGPYGMGAVGRAGWLIKVLVGKKHQIVKVDYETEMPMRDPQTGFCVRAEWGEPGELLWELDQNDITKSFQGYFNNKEATEKKILRDVFKKGDAWFRTGDVQRWDLDGFLYFVDRIGDTYRWKSENVSTNDVAETFARFPSGGIQECNVYGIELPNHDGRAGCAAFTLSPGVGGEEYMRELGEWAKRVMPRFKVPVFVRTMGKPMEVTGTNKHVKTGLRTEGVDPGKVGTERVWWLGSGRTGEEGTGYVPFTRRDWEGIVGGGRNCERNGVESKEGLGSTKICRC